MRTTNSINNECLEIINRHHIVKKLTVKKQNPDYQMYNYHGLLSGLG
jgi:hypothetical protein